ncbi:MAG: hypothetical protein SFV21_06370 [Rhodospirillaceae bacterium]|nr:hypothetical protein [Rhodospirillaceae bacterium]
MSTAQVVNVTMASTVARMSSARAAVASTFQTVEGIDTNSLSARGRDQARARDDNDQYDAGRLRRRSPQVIDRVISFGGVLVSQEVGSAIVQAQAAAGKIAPTLHPADAERGVSIYEFNQSLMGAPQVTTDVGVVH